jgi:hypothetical protein
MSGNRKTPGSLAPNKIQLNSNMELPRSHSKITAGKCVPLECITNIMSYIIMEYMMLLYEKSWRMLFPVYLDEEKIVSWRMWPGPCCMTAA